MCARHLQRLDDADDLHDLGSDLLAFCKAHPGPEAVDCLLYVYELSPCSTCRKHAVKALTDTATAPAWVLEEIAFDVDPDTRALARAPNPACPPAP
jgi:hypothetical protein